MKSENTKRFIYCLKRKNTEEIFYIGVTGDCKVRLSAHKANFGNDIFLEVIEEASSLNKSLERERHWIQEYTKDGIILDNKVGFILTPTKTIKIPNAVHTELKVFVASKSFNIEDIAGFAIMEYLKTNGHKFIVKQKKQSN